MLVSHRSLLVGMSIALGAAMPLHAANDNDGHSHQRLKEPKMPRQSDGLPPSDDQIRFNLQPSKSPRKDLKQPVLQKQSLAATADCKDMNKMATYSGAALAQYVATLPDYSCTYPLFTTTPALASTIYSPANMSAVASRFMQEATSYNATNMALVNLTLYLRAGYYQAYGGGIPEPSASFTQSLRAPIKSLIDGSALWVDNPVAGSTAGELHTLITNMHDEVYFLPTMKSVVQRFTNTASQPTAANKLKEYTAGAGFTGVLTIFFRAHSIPEGITLLQNDPSYPTALNTFVVNNKPALLGTSGAYELFDGATEAFRFMKYSGLVPTVRPMIQNTLATSTMTGADNDLWIKAASAVSYYDSANCGLYGTCNFKTDLANAVLVNSYTCSPTIRIRAQDMTTAQLQGACNTLGAEEGYFHQMLKTNNTPVANDRNTSLELVVFDDYTNYNKYASVIYDMNTDNGGMYLEGDPTSATNQARFVAHEASWLRPTFQIWNLEHEYVHYLDGRFDMLGDFAAATVKPTVWWIEGIAEYLSLKNNNQVAIDTARTGTYKLSQIFGNTYDMSDYQTRAYKWGYMATRFMVERHRADVDAAVAKFRVGDYTGYQTQMNAIGTGYDNEFINWVSTATTAGTPPLPQPALPACSSTSQLGKNCQINNISSSSQAYLYLMLPAGAKNVKLQVFGGTGVGDADLYVAVDRYPTTTSYDFASANVGNNETVSIATPVTGHWYYIVLKAKTAFSNVSVAATYD